MNQKVALEVFIRARDKASKIIAGVGKLAKKVGKAVGVAIAAGFAAGLNAVINFEKGMAEVFTLMPGITGEAMTKMEDQMKAFASEAGTLFEKSMLSS